LPPQSVRTTYHGLVITLGALAVGHALWLTTTSPPDGRWLVLCVLTLTGAIATLRMRATRISFSISDTFTFAALLLFGPAPATITASLEAMTISCLLSREQRRPSRVAFGAIRSKPPVEEGIHLYQADGREDVSGAMREQNCVFIGRRNSMSRLELLFKPYSVTPQRLTVRRSDLSGVIGTTRPQQHAVLLPRR
jgi:hypothetical protein